MTCTSGVVRRSWRVAAFMLLLAGVLLLSAGAAEAQHDESVDEMVREAARRLAEPDTLGAIDQLDKVLAREPKHVDALLLRAKAKFRLEQYDAIVADMTTILDAQPEHVDALCLRADAYKSLEQEPEALRDVMRAIRLKPDGALGYAICADIYLSLFDENSAVAELAKAMKIDPDLPQAHRVVARMAYNKRRYEMARASLQRAVDLGTDDIRVYKMLRMTHAWLGMQDTLLNDYDQILRLNPLTAHAYYHRSEVYREKQMLDDALKNAMRAVELDDTNWRYHDELARVYTDMHRYLEGGEQYAIAAKLPGGNNPVVNFNAGWAFGVAGEDRRAVPYLEAALEQRPDDVPTLLELLVVHYQLANYDQARLYAIAALKLHPHQHRGLRQYIALCYYFGEHEEGAAAGERFLARHAWKHRSSYIMAFWLVVHQHKLNQQEASNRVIDEAFDQCEAAVGACDEIRVLKGVMTLEAYETAAGLNELERTSRYVRSVLIRQMRGEQIDPAATLERLIEFEPKVSHLDRLFAKALIAQLQTRFQQAWKPDARGQS